MMLILSEESGAVRGRQKLLSDYMVWFLGTAMPGIISGGGEGPERETET